MNFIQFCHQRKTFLTLNLQIAYFLWSKMSLKGIIMFLGMNNTRLERKILLILDFENGFLPTYLPQCCPQSEEVLQSNLSESERYRVVRIKRVRKELRIFPKIWVKSNIFFSKKRFSTSEIVRTLVLGNTAQWSNSLERG